MEIKITAKNGTISQEIQDKITRKVSNLSRLFNRLTAVHVMANFADSNEPKVEMIASAEQVNDFVASEKGVNIMAAFDLTISKLEQQLRKQKEKLTEHRGPGKQSYDDLD